MRRGWIAAGVAMLVLSLPTSAGAGVTNSHAFSFGLGTNCADQAPDLTCDLSKMRIPTGIAVASDGRVFVTDTKVSPVRDRVAVFDAAGLYLGSISSHGAALGELNSVSDVALGTDGLLYVVDLANSRIQTFQPNIGAPAPAVFLSQIAPLPYRIDVAPDGGFAVSVFASDPPQVRKYDESGALSADMEFPPDTPTFAQDVAVAPTGDIYVAVSDPANKIYRFKSDGSFLGSFGDPGEGEGQLDEPESLDIDSRGFVYVTEYDSSHGYRISRFRPDGTFEGVLPQQPGFLNLHKGLTVDSKDNVLAIVNGFPADYSVIRYASKYVRLSKKPKASTRSRKAAFAFSSQLASPGFRCKLDAKPWSLCPPSKTFRNLKVRLHSLQVAVRESPSAVWGPVTAYKWRVKP